MKLTPEQIQSNWNQLLKYIDQFLSEEHPNAIGLSVPGMPLGSPGMEVEGMFTPYNVLILFKDGTSDIYAEVKE